MNWTVSRRIVLGFSVLLALTLLMAAAGIGALRQAVRADRAALAQEHLAEVALAAEGESREANLQYLRFLLDPQPEYLRHMDSTTALTRTLLQEARARARTLGAPEEDWEESLRRTDAWQLAARASVDAGRAGDAEAARRIWSERALPARLAVRTTIDRGVEQARRTGEEASARATATATRMQRVLWGCALLALGLGVLTAWLLNRAVTAPLRDTTSVLAATAAEILAASSQQAASASETSAAVVETSTTVDEVAQTSEQAADRARAVAETAQRSAEIGRTGRAAVEESIRTMEGVKEQVESIADSVVVLAEQAQAIGEIIATVNEIAEQTNLLALNAAVEAARAGEHGRGFAVVAGEVRSLAEQSKRATVQVRQILGEIQRATSAAVMTTERGTHQVAAGTRQVNDAGETIRALAETVVEASQAAAQILASAGQQAAGMSQIRQAMRSIQEATQQTLASTRQAEQAAADLDRMGSRLVGLVGAERSAPYRGTPERA